MKTISRIVVSTLVILMLATLGTAATISFSDYVPGPGAGTFSTLNFSGTFSLPQFDSSLGTLTGVQLEYTSGWQGVTSSYTNTGGAGTARLQASFLSTLSGGLINTLFTNPVLYDTGLQAVAGGGTLSSGVAPLSGTDGPTAVAITGLLASFIGAGTVDFDIEGVLVVTNTFIGSFVGSQSAEGRGQLTITYTYDEAQTGIPEPSTMLLLGSGLLIAGFARRFRKS